MAEEELRKEDSQQMVGTDVEKADEDLEAEEDEGLEAEEDAGWEAEEDEDLESKVEDDE